MEENERLRGLLDRVVMEVGRTITSELRADIDATLSQQTEPTDAFTAVDMATAAAQGFRDGQAAVEQAPAQDDREPLAWLIDWPEEPELGHYFSDEPNEHARSRPLYAAPIAQTASQDLRAIAMLVAEAAFKAGNGHDRSVASDMLREIVNSVFEQLGMQTAPQQEQSGLVEAVKEAVKYLDENYLNQISSRSRIHLTLRAALSAQGESHE